MRPTVPLSNPRNQGHRNTEASRQIAAYPVILWRLTDYFYIAITQFCCNHFLSARPALVAGLPGVPFSPQNALGIQLLPRNFRAGFRSSQASLGGQSVPISIAAILFCGGPIQVFRSVVRFIIVAMSAVQKSLWLRPVERCADKPMNWSGELYAGFAENHPCVLAAKRGLKKASGVFPLPIRQAPPNKSIARNLIRGGLGDYSPLSSSLHQRRLAAMLFNVKKSDLYRSATA